MDNGDSRISADELVYSDSVHGYVFSLEQNHDRLVIDANIQASYGHIWVAGNNFALTGTGGAGFDFGGQDAHIFDMQIVGNFDYGVFGYGLKDSDIINIDVANARIGIDVDTDYGRIAYSEIQNVTYAGIVERGGHNQIDNNYVHGVHSPDDGVAISFAAYNQTGNVLSNSTMDGTGDGHTWGLWSDNDDLLVFGVYDHDWLQGAGVVGHADVVNSTFDNFFANAGDITFDQGCVVVEHFWWL